MESGRQRELSKSAGTSDSWAIDRLRGRSSSRGCFTVAGDRERETNTRFCG